MTTTASSTLPFPKKNARPALVPEINVTPLVDVVLVLLIIFMVIAPQLEAGERVELPSLINGVKYGKVRTMLASAQDIGFPGVALMVDERKPDGKAASN